jgi:hypothetical protein
MPSAVPPPSPPEFDPAEAPTQPDASRIKCPACCDEGGIARGGHSVEIRDEQGHIAKMTWRTCRWCDGRCWVDLATLGRWNIFKPGAR